MTLTTEESTGRMSCCPVDVGLELLLYQIELELLGYRVRLKLLDYHVKKPLMKI